MRLKVLIESGNNNKVVKSRQSLVPGCIIFFFILLSFIFSTLFPGIINTFDLQFHDFLFRLRYKITGRGKVSPFIVHTVFNDETLEKYNLSLLDRKIYADLITSLNRAGAKYVAFDIFFQHPGREEDDRFLAAAAGKYNNTYFPVILFPGIESDNIPEIDKNILWHPLVKKKGNPYKAGIITMPFKELADASYGMGHVNINPDPDGITRRFPLLYQCSDGFVPSLTFAMICTYLDIDSSDIEIAFGQHIRLKGARFRGNLLKDIVIPINNRGEVRINYIAPWRDSFYEYSTEELLNTLEYPILAARLRDEIEHSVVVVSDNSTRNNDTGAGVFDTIYPNSEIHVTIANMILTGEFIREPGHLLSWGVILIFGVCIWFYSLKFRIWKSLLFSLLMYAGYIVFAGLLFIFFNILIQIITVSIFFFLSLLGCFFYRFLLEEQAHAEEKKKREILAVIDNLKTRFLYNITDDLKSPLSPVISLSKDMKDNFDKYNEEQSKQALKQINDGAVTLCNKIGELSELTELDAGLLPLCCEKTYIIPFFKKIMKTFGLDAGKKKITMAVEPESNDIYLYIDRKKIEKVISHLIDNAIKFTGKRGRITIAVSGPLAYKDSMYSWKRKTGKPECVIQIRISDTGKGIEKKHLELIFKRFWKPPDDDELNNKGTGIGLALVKEFVCLHAGNIAVSSTPGEGSVFTIMLPMGSAHLYTGEIIERQENVNDNNRKSGRQEPDNIKGKMLYPEKPILIVNENKKETESVGLILSTCNMMNIITIQDVASVIDSIETDHPCLIIADHSFPRFDGLYLIKTVYGQYPDIPIIITAGTRDLKTAMKCIKAGAADYLIKPIDGKELTESVKYYLNLCELRKKRNKNSAKMEINKNNKNPFKNIMTNSRQMKEIFSYIKRIAPTDEHILIRGETGVGKELIAEAIHHASERRGELVVINTAGIDDTLFSDTLFGHVPGAFNDAIKKRDGLIATAEKGTIFLDEIGDLEMKSQIKLLRLLQTGDYFSLGSDKKKVTNVKVIAATNAGLEELVHKKIFREDLYHRLNALEIKVPPLRERPEDIELLIEFFLHKYESVFKYDSSKIEILPDTYKLFMEYNYPGNVRELENIMKAALSSMKKSVLSHKFIKEKMGYGNTQIETIHRKTKIFYSGRMPQLQEAEDFLISKALKVTDNNKTKAAQLLGISRFALNRKLGKK